MNSPNIRGIKWEIGGETPAPLQQRDGAMVNLLLAWPDNLVLQHQENLMLQPLEAGDI